MERKKFFVLEALDEPSDIFNAVKTFHLENERNTRTAELPTNIGKPVKSFLVDTAHPNGNEVHTLTEDGLIFIQNEKTNKIIRRLCDGKNVIWFDWRAGLYKGGTLDKSLWFDREHPGDGGYRVWAKALLPYFSKRVP